MFGFLNKFKYEKTHEPEMSVEQDDREIEGLTTITTEPTDDGSSGEVSVRDDDPNKLGFAQSVGEWVESKVEVEKTLKDGTVKKSYKTTYTCPICGRKSAAKTNFCPNCGKKLRDTSTEG